MTVLPLETSNRLPGDFDQGSGRLWSASLGVIAAAHLAAAGLLLVQFGRAPVMPPPPAALPIMIEMAPMPSAPKPPPPQPVVKPVEPDPLPKAPVVEKAEVALPKPKPKPKIRKPVEKRIEKPMPPTPATKPAPQTQADTSARPTAPAKAAPDPGEAASSQARITYEGMLQAHLRRFQRYPQEARRRHQEGTAYVRIRIARDGTLILHTLERTSGFDKLDNEVLAMMERAVPMPAFLADMKENSREFVVPVIFNLK
ncbi:MAG: TonB family protein [Parvibaculaceae bacterium]|nr:TonB family protein [Parvibaculaceae bacterium]